MKYLTQSQIENHHQLLRYLKRNLIALRRVLLYTPHRFSMFQLRKLESIEKFLGEDA